MEALKRYWRGCRVKPLLVETVTAAPPADPVPLTTAVPLPHNHEVKYSPRPVENPEFRRRQRIVVVIEADS